MNFARGRAKNRRRLCARPAGNELTSSSLPARPPRRRRPEKVHASRVAAEEKGPPGGSLFGSLRLQKPRFLQAPPSCRKHSSHGGGEAARFFGVEAAINTGAPENRSEARFLGKRSNKRIYAARQTLVRRARILPCCDERRGESRSGFPSGPGGPQRLCVRPAGKRTYFVIPSCTATAQATVMPTMGLLPAPIRPIISTCAGTEEEPANCASECMRPIVSVMP